MSFKKVIWLIILFFPFITCSYLQIKKAKQFYNWGVENYLKGEIKTAEEFFQKSLSIYPLAEAYYNLGIIYKDRQEYSQAIDAWEKALILNPKLPSTYLNLGFAYLKLRKYPEALAAFESEKQVNKEYQNFFNHQAEVFLAQGDYKKALAAFKKALNDNPQSLSALLGIGRVYLKQREIEKAEAHFKEIIKSFPNDERAYCYLGILAREYKQDYSAACRFLQEAFRIAPESKFAGVELAETYIILGTLARLNQKYGEAERNFLEAERLLPNSSRIQQKLGKLYRLKGDFSKAVKAYQKAIALAPTESNYCALVSLYLRQKRYGEALEVIKEGLRINPNFLKLYLFKAQSYSKMGKWSEAVSVYKEALKKFPDKSIFYNELGYLYAQQGVKLSEAIGLLTRAIELAREEEKPYYYDSLGWVYFKKGEYKLAEEWLKKALRDALTPRLLSTIHFHLSEVYLAMGKRKEAYQELKRVIEISKKRGIEAPEYKKASQRLKEWTFR
jgi:tetratricopeptide (TPR) repeat protein